LEARAAKERQGRRTDLEDSNITHNYEESQTTEKVGKGKSLELVIGWGSAFFQQGGEK